MLPVPRALAGAREAGAGRRAACFLQSKVKSFKSLCDFPVFIGPPSGL